MVATVTLGLKDDLSPALSKIDKNFDTTRKGVQGLAKDSDQAARSLPRLRCLVRCFRHRRSHLLARGHDQMTGYILALFIMLCVIAAASGNPS